MGAFFSDHLIISCPYISKHCDMMTQLELEDSKIYLIHVRLFIFLRRKKIKFFLENNLNEYDRKANESALFIIPL